MNNEYYTTEYVSDKFKVSRQTIWRWKKLGILKSTKIGRRHLFRDTDILELLEQK